MQIDKHLRLVWVATLIAACTPAAAPPPAAEKPNGDEVRVAQGNPPSEDVTDGNDAGLDGPGSVPSLEVIRPGEVVPAFDVTAEDGTVLDSAKLVGTEPFVMVFFASWCKVCEMKLPVLKDALARAGGDILVIAVALDQDDTWERVPEYLARHELGPLKLVRGQAHRGFALAYNPFGSVPVVEVVDRHGVIAELQRGHQAGHAEGLLAALEHVREEPAQAP